MSRPAPLRADGQPADVDCGCCGRFIGPELTCPYCGADAERRAPIRFLRLLAVFLAVGGLLALGFQARHTPLPLVRAADVRPGMAMACVRMTGTVATTPRTIDEHGQPDYVSFDLDDGSGRVTVTAARDVARALAGNAAALPHRGDRVDVRGRLGLAAERRPRLYLDDPSDLRVAAATGEAFR